MIIESINIIKTRDAAKHAWSRIMQFQNIQLTVDSICKLHNIPESDKNNKSNARSQAEQIKYCLSQAKEYFDAANVVSLATKPVLLYYSAMSMALAEILLKQNGDSRLTKLREEHNCHGLQLGVKSTPKIEDKLADSAATLIAKPQRDITGAPKGTFEVWRRSAREYPAGGKLITLLSGGANQQTYRVLFTANDSPPPFLPRSGISLLDCFRELPYMSELLRSLQTRSNLIRAKLSAMQADPTATPEIELIIHPADDDLIEKFGNLVQAAPDLVNIMEFIDFPSGYILKYRTNGPSHLSFPGSICLNNETIHFSCSGLDLGEFGFLYCALHICGNFARYYPDIWLKHIEKSSPLAIAIDELCAHSFDRLPLLTLSELTRTYHVVEA
ncbi:YaaC family protein [Burkholderia ubonensis]|uniref:YaaC family protein n=1 Tax=Burkholderia ubonensis TaxID=101571 RepID=UPI0009B3F9B8|nr:YaaC family protein [Burkholderia ubonensis]